MDQYTVQSGDTLSQIGARFGLNYNDIASRNNITNPNRIYVGQNLNLRSPQQLAPMINQPSQVPNIPVPTNREAFSKILPANYLDSLINQLAQSQVNPEINRTRDASLTNYYRQIGRSGGYKSGVALQNKENILNSIERQRAEQIGSFDSSLRTRASDSYNRLYENYYKNPGSFVAPKATTYDDFIRQNPDLLNSYNNQTNNNNYNPTFRF